jgi:hypothetical protein
VNLFAKQWRKADGPTKEIEKRIFQIPTLGTPYEPYYDEIQMFLKSVSGLDPLLEGAVYNFHPTWIVDIPISSV